MPTNGMTINGLNTVSELTAQDELPVWDNESSGEPTKKITASNLAASVKSLADLPNTTEMNAAIQQSTARLTNTLKKMSYAGYKASGSTLTPDGFGMGDLLMLYGDPGESVTIYTTNGNRSLISIMQGNRTASLSWNGDTPTITFNNACYYAFVHVNTVNNL